MNGSRVAEYLFHSIVAMMNLFCGRTMHDYELFHHEIIIPVINGLVQGPGEGR